MYARFGCLRSALPFALSHGHDSPSQNWLTPTRTGSTVISIVGTLRQDTCIFTVGVSDFKITLALGPGDVLSFEDAY